MPSSFGADFWPSFDAKDFETGEVHSNVAVENTFNHPVLDSPLSLLKASFDFSIDSHGHLTSSKEFSSLFLPNFDCVEILDQTLEPQSDSLLLLQDYLALPYDLNGSQTDSNPKDRFSLPDALTEALSSPYLYPLSPASSVESVLFNVSENILPSGHAMMPLYQYPTTTTNTMNPPSPNSSDSRRCTPNTTQTRSPTTKPKPPSKSTISKQKRLTFTCPSCGIQSAGQAAGVTHCLETCYSHASVNVSGTLRFKDDACPFLTGGGAQKSCGRRFEGPNWKHNMAHHLSTHVVRERQFACAVCPKRYMNQKSLRNHVKEHEGGVFPCDRCLETFPTTGLRDRHVAEHRRNGDVKPIRKMRDETCKK